MRDRNFDERGRLRLPKWSPRSYIPLRPEVLDDRVVALGRARTVEQWLWLGRLEDPEERAEIVKSIVANVGVEESVLILWIHPPSEPPPSVVAVAGEEAAIPEHGFMLSEIALHLAAQLGPETSAALDRYAQAWLSEPSQDRWVSVGIQLVDLSSSLARAGMSPPPPHLAEALDGLHELPALSPRRRTIETRVVVLLRSVDRASADAIWGRIRHHYPEGLAALRARWEDQLQRVLSWPSSELLAPYR